VFESSIVQKGLHNIDILFQNVGHVEIGQCLLVVCLKYESHEVGSRKRWSGGLSNCW